MIDTNTPLVPIPCLPVPVVHRPEPRPPREAMGERSRGREAPACVPTGAGGSSRLEQRTYLDDTGTNPRDIRVTATLRDYGNHLAEVGWSVQTTPRRTTPRGSGNRAENSNRAARRAVATVRRKCMAMGADRLLTLTYRENLTDPAEAWEHWQKFARACRDRFDGFKYVVVPEKQKRGAIHFHVALNRFYSVRTLRAIWREIIGEGNVDMTSPRSGGKWKVQKLANYLSKYIAKTIQTSTQKDENEQSAEAAAQLVPLGAHRFRAALGIEITTMIRTFTGMEAEHLALLWLNEVAGSIGFIWKKDERYMCGWACSWG